MPTVCLDSKSNNKYYIQLTIENSYGISFYKVELFPIIGGECGFPIKSNIYNEEIKAKNRYKRLIKEYIPD